jgi:hypothetical protein
VFGWGFLFHLAAAQRELRPPNGFLFHRQMLWFLKEKVLRMGFEIFLGGSSFVVR